jgi:hypothetical protein
VGTRPSFRGTIEVQQIGEHRVVLDGVEHVRMAIHQLAERRADRKERVRRHDQAARFLRLQLGEVVKAVHPLGGGREIQEQDVTSFDGALDAGNQRDAAISRVLDEGPDIELTVVKCNRQRAVVKLRGTVDKLMRRVRHAVDRIVRRVSMQIDLQHSVVALQNPCREEAPRWLAIRAARA